MTATVAFLVRKRSGPARLGYAPVLLHVAASATGGALSGLLIAHVGGLLRHLWIVSNFLVGALLVAAAWDLLRLSMRHLQPRNGVPAAWRHWSPTNQMIAYGGILGTAFVTPYGAAAVYALAAGVLLVADSAVGSLTFGLYGIVRAAVPILGAVSVDPSVLPTLISRFQSARHVWRPVLGFVSLLLGFRLM